MSRIVLLTADPYSAAKSLASGPLVLTPNRLAAAALQAPSQSLDQLARQAVSHAGLEPASALGRQRLLRQAVREAAPRLGDRGVAGVEPALHRALRAGLDFARLAGDGPTPRARELGAVGQRYQDLLAARRLLDPAAVIRHAAGLGGAPRRLALLGYPRLEDDAVRLLARHAAAGSTVVLPWLPAEPRYAANEAAAEALAAGGWEVHRDAAAPPAPATVAAYRYPDLEAEVRGALALVKQRLQDPGRHLAPRDLVVVVRDEPRYGPTLRAIARELDLPLTLAYDVPLRETRLGQWLAQGLEALAEGLPYEATLRWTQARWLGEPLDRQLEARRQRASGVGQWAELADLATAYQQLAAGAPAAVWGEWLHGLLGRLAKAPALLRSARDQLAGQRLETALRQLTADLGDAPLDGPAFAAEVGDLLDTLTVAYQPGAGGVAVHTPLALFGARYRCAVVLGLAEGLLPAPVAHDPYLDFLERETLNAWLDETGQRDCGRLETAVEAARREALSFWTLLAGITDELLLCRPATLDQRPVEPSAFLAALAVGDSPPPDLVAGRPAWRQRVLQQPDAWADDAPLPGAATAREVELRREGDAPPDAHDGVLDQRVPPPAHFSASSLTTLGQCPFRWFAGRALGLEPVDEPGAEPDALTRGGLLHRVLELAVRAALDLGCLRDPARLDRLLELAMEVASGGQVGDDDLSRAVQAAAAAGDDRGTADDDDRGRFLGRLANWSRIRAEWLATLRRAVHSQGFLLDDAEPVDVEHWFRGDWHRLPVIGRIDRVDRGADGSVTLIDYKSGSSLPPGIQDPATGRLAVDLQLALYEACYAAAGPVAGTYFALGSGERKGGQTDPEVLAAFAALVPRWLVNGSFPVQPDADGAACRFCDFDAVCRRGLRLARKERPSWLAD